jgi:hypothetical protein
VVRPSERDRERETKRQREKQRDRETERDVGHQDITKKRTKIPRPQREPPTLEALKRLLFFSIVGRSSLEKDRLIAQSAHPQPNYLSN